MSITAELKNIKKFESVGFTHEQAEVPTESLEEAVTSGNESLKDFISQQIKELRYELKADISETSKDLLVKLFAIIFGTSGMLFAMLKLFG